MVSIVVDQFTTMAHCIPLKKKDIPMVARADLDNKWKYHGYPENVVSDRDSTFTGSLFMDLYNSLEIQRSMLMAYHPQIDSQMEPSNQVI
jgi:hypothetical protein